MVSTLDPKKNMDATNKKQIVSLSQKRKETVKTNEGQEIKLEEVIKQIINHHIGFVM